MSRQTNLIAIHNPAGFALGNGATRSTLTSVGQHAINLPNASGNLLTTTNSVVLQNKTLINSNNNVTASSLFSNAGANIVDVRASTSPIAGQALTAINGTTATWQNVSAPGTSQSTGKVTTNNNTSSTIQSFSTVDGGVYYITSNIAALGQSGTDNAGAAYTIKAAYKRIDGNVIRIGPIDDIVAFEDNNGFNVFTTIDGDGNILLQVVGDEDYTVDWVSATTIVSIEGPPP